MFGDKLEEQPNTFPANLLEDTVAVHTPGVAKQVNNVASFAVPLLCLQKKFPRNVQHVIRRHFLIHYDSYCDTFYSRLWFSIVFKFRKVAIFVTLDATIN